MKVRLASNLQPDSIVDGEGIRTVIWMQGCLHSCPYCHNPGTHDLNGGYEIELEEILEEIDSLKGQDGITFSGGDPLYQIEATIELAKHAKKRNLSTWLYTGFTYEEVCKMKQSKELFKYIDVLVDGPFIIEKRTLDAPFRGSSNQRIIDIKKSTPDNIVVLDKYNKIETKLYKKNDKIFI